MEPRIRLIAYFCLTGLLAFPAMAQDPGKALLAAAFEASRQQEFTKALEYFDQAEKYYRDKPSFYQDRGETYVYAEKYTDARKDFDRALELATTELGVELHPTLARHYFSRGSCHQQAGEFAAAVADYERTIDCRPDMPAVKNQLAWILATAADDKLRDPARAVKLATRECQETDFKVPAYLDTLAAAHAANGDFAKAVEIQGKAIARLGDQPAAREFRERLELYRRQQPYVTPDSAP